MEGFTLEGPRAGDWRVAIALVAVAGFSLALAAMYGSSLAMLGPLLLVLLAAESIRRWYRSPRVRLIVDEQGIRYSLGNDASPIRWETIRGIEKRPLGGRDCVILKATDGDEMPLDPGALGLTADELFAMLDGCRRAATPS